MRFLHSSFAAAALLAKLPVDTGRNASAEREWRSSVEAPGRTGRNAGAEGLEAINSAAALELLDLAERYYASAYIGIAALPVLWSFMREYQKARVFTFPAG
mgnify:CR=1 FL=1